MIQAPVIRKSHFQVLSFISWYLRADAEKHTDEKKQTVYFLAKCFFSWARAHASGAEPRTPNYKSNSRALSLEVRLKLQKT